jgi:hypothetical protein
VLTKLFQGLMLHKLLAAHKAGRLTFFGQHAHLADRKAFAAYLAPLRRIKWYVYSKLRRPCAARRGRGRSRPAGRSRPGSRRPTCPSAACLVSACFSPLRVP